MSRIWESYLWRLSAKVAGYAGLLLATPTVLYQIAAYVIPGLTRSERQLLAPIVFGSIILFYLGCAQRAPVAIVFVNVCIMRACETSATVL